MSKRSLVFKYQVGFLHSYSILDIPGLVAIVAFAATDIDDLFLLMMFFSSRIYPARQVVIGQQLGLLGFDTSVLTLFLKDD
jgi:cadmium resistance protein CadD (predicted permease)